MTVKSLLPAGRQRFRIPAGSLIGADKRVLQMSCGAVREQTGMHLRRREWRRVPTCSRKVRIVLPYRARIVLDFQSRSALPWYCVPSRTVLITGVLRARQRPTVVSDTHWCEEKAANAGGRSSASPGTQTEHTTLVVLYELVS